jgi:hypothetical protein
MGNTAPSTPPPSSCTPHGTSFTLTSTAATDNTNTTHEYCTCETGWQGHGSDFFDTRVSTGGGGGGMMQTSCHVNDLAIDILWGMVILMIAWRQLFTYLGFRVQCHKHSGTIRHIRKRRGNLLLWIWMFAHQTFRVCLVDLFIANPLTMSVAILKLSRREVLGTDPASTIAFAIAVPISLFAYASFQVFQFGVVTTRQQHQGLRTLHRRLMFASPILFTLLSSVPAIIMLFVDHSVTPYENNSGIILTVRVAGVFLWQFVTAVSVYILSRESSNVLELFAKTPAMSESRKRVRSTNQYDSREGAAGDDDSLSATNTNKNIATEAVRQLKKQAGVVAYRTVMVIVITLPFMVPLLWPYYCYAVPIAVSLVCSTSPGIEMWYIHRAAAKAASETTSIMRTSLAPGGGNNGGALAARPDGEKSNGPGPRSQENI